ncbi:5-methylcytosine restriction system specificity protein McrC [Flagellimonas lutimaris]|uniref:5-methylcytosine restriction system specificity protein McrC n=1 Tax=Flagellimonas lutimaris TaxID=475082 RepID=UPI003F5CC913
MNAKKVHIKEHSISFDLNEEELIDLLKNPNQLVEEVDLERGYIKTGYFIGLTRLGSTDSILNVTPKLDTEITKINYLSMLSKGMQHPEMVSFGKDLFYVDLDAKPIKVKREQDLITPFIIVGFLQLLTILVKKGLMKSYYKVERNIYGNVRGKILVSKTTKQNLLRNKNLYTHCTFEEFGVDNLENRILKKALLFSIKYLKSFNTLENRFEPLINYISPAFRTVNSSITIPEIKHFKTDNFFPEYNRGLELAKMIIKRFGYNINSITPDQEVNVYPYWIDMPKLFEFYVLGILKEKFGRKDIIFQFNAHYGELDYLRVTEGKELVIDAKYKNLYASNNYEINDIRQLSGYARDKKTLARTKIKEELWKSTLLNCLIVYPNQSSDNLENLDAELFLKPISQFENFYKIGVKIPTKNLV